MSTLSHSLVLVTGASAGIGRSCAVKFAEAGARLILIARRSKALEGLSKELQETSRTKVHTIGLDIRDRRAVETAFNGLPPEWQEIDILVNNAGLSRGLDKLHEGTIDDWEEMIDTNVKGLLYVSRAALPGMVGRGKGTIINIGSIAGHEVYPRGNVYSATKHAVDALTKGMRMDLIDTPLRVCTVDPGLVETEFSMVRYRGDVQKAKATYQSIQPLKPDDVAEAVVFCATRPPHVQIAEIIVLPTTQASTTMVHRER